MHSQKQERAYLRSKQALFAINSTLSSVAIQIIASYKMQDIESLNKAIAKLNQIQESNLNIVADIEELATGNRPFNADRY